MSSSRFDEFTKGLARGTTRRQALKAIAATLGGTLGLGQAERQRAERYPQLRGVRHRLHRHDVGLL